jgi:hypothetical protein
VHPLAEFGNEVQPVGDEQMLGQWLGQIALVTKELADESLCYMLPRNACGDMLD